METTPKPSASEPDRDSLCELCAKCLKLDDSRAGGELGTLSDGSKTYLSFPNIEWQNDIQDSAIWGGGNDYERTVTPPDLPELSNGRTRLDNQCRFCTALARALAKRFGEESWWRTTTTPLRIKIEYYWLGLRGIWATIHQRPYYSLGALGIRPSHPDLDQKTADFSFKVTALQGECRKQNFLGFSLLKLYFPTGKCREWLQIRRRPVNPKAPLSPGNVKRIRRWISAPIRTVDGKGSRTDKDFFPRMLLDIGVTDSAEGVKLIDTQKSPPHSPGYACLSYCWGSTSLPLRTTSESLEKHLQGIPYDEIPQLFKDAIVVTRALELRYLWIDSLCIIQDSELDWEEQSGKMSEIFCHSTVTIGAAAAFSSKDSFLRNRPDDNLRIGFQSTVDPNIQGRFSIHLVDMSGLHSVISPQESGTASSWTQDLAASKWNSRGWVWQEQNMSLRLLVFGEKMLHMKSRQHIRSEDGSVKVQDGAVPGGRSRLPNEWIRWVLSEYCLRKLTYRSDKLAAAAGPAKDFQHLTTEKGNSPQYIAGFFLYENLCFDLLWGICHPTMSFRQMLCELNDPGDYCAPSWSWASRDEIPHDLLIQNGKSDCLKVLGYDLIPAKSDAAVRLRPGSSITFRGKVHKVTHRPSSGVITLDDRSDEIQSPLENRSGESLPWVTGWRTESEHCRLHYFLDWNPLEDEDHSQEDQLYLLETGALSESFRRYGLVLFPISLERMEFLRVGVFSLHMDYPEKDVADEYLSGWTMQDLTVM